MIYKDGPFTLTDGNHYFVLMADHKYNDESDHVEYSGMHHATRDSARTELGYVHGDDWGDHIKSIEVKEVC